MNLLQRMYKQIIHLYQRVSNRSANVELLFKDHLKVYCELPFSENFLSTFPLTKFSFYLSNFCGKNTVTKILKGHSLWDNTFFKYLCWMECNNDKSGNSKLCEQKRCFAQLFSHWRIFFQQMQQKGHQLKQSQLYSSWAAKLDPSVSHRSSVLVGPVTISYFQRSSLDYLMTSKFEIYSEAKRGLSHNLRIWIKR